MRDIRHARGSKGEDIAADFLIRKGYVVLERNYRNPSTRWEIDVIAQFQDTIVFVEVKTGTREQFGTPESRVHPLKQRRIAHTAQCYLQDRNLPEACCRFDVISVMLNITPPRITHIEQAFWSVL
jgi:putative endonuclease